MEITETETISPVETPNRAATAIRTDGSADPHKADSLFTRVNRYAGMIALVLSLIIGGLEVYERTIQKSADDRQELMDRVSTISKGLDALQMERSYFSNNPSSVQAMYRLPKLNAERLRLLDQLDALPSRSMDKMNAVELGLFGAEFLNTGQFSKAVEYLEASVKNADEAYIRDGSEHFLARALFPPSEYQDVQRGREIMRTLSARFEASNQPQDMLNYAQLKQGWISGEILAGNCDDAEVILDELLVHQENMNAMRVFGAGGGKPDP